MSEFIKTTSYEEIMELKKMHNIVQKDGTVLVQKTYADVVKQTGNQQHGNVYSPSPEQIENFRKMNPYMFRNKNGFFEINPNDSSNCNFEMPPPNSLYFEN
jgi:hypothetical protein